MDNLNYFFFTGSPDAIRWSSPARRFKTLNGVIRDMTDEEKNRLRECITEIDVIERLKPPCTECGK